MNNNNNNSNGSAQESTNKVTSKSNKESLNTLSNKVKTMEDNNEEIRKNIDELYMSIHQMNKNMEKMMEKFDSIVTDQYIDRQQTKTEHGMRKIVTHPLRSLMVGVLSGVYAVTDKTTEVVSGVKENIEDVLAEAQYKNKQRRINKSQEQF